MDTKHLERFAQGARRQLHEEVTARLARVLRTDSAELRAKAETIRALRREIDARSRESVIEQVAYTWFNRFIALRYMDVNGITRMGTVSPAMGPDGVAFTQPELLQEAKQGIIDDEIARYVDAERVFGLLNGRLPSGDPQQEAYRLLLVAVCRAYHDPMPFMFQPIDDYTELLMPDDLLSEGSILQAVRQALTAESCQDVEVIGWLYQYYISEKKDAVMARKAAVPPEDIPAVTQLFTPHWIVRYMVENSLGRVWMMNHPESRLAERMAYYIAAEGEDVAGHDSRLTIQGAEVKSQKSRVNGGYPVIGSPEEIRLCDPACGSGHILTYAFDLLYAIYEEAGYDPVAIPRLILEKNLTGIEIDPRAGALAGFALMMKALEKDRRFLRRGVQPNIIVMQDVSFTPQELDAYMDAVGRDLFTQDVRDWLQQFEHASIFGSLIRPLVKDTAFIRQRLEEIGIPQDLFLSGTQGRVDAELRMTEALSAKYHAVVANPPYMGSRNQPSEVRQFLKDKYDDVKSDLFSAFALRCSELGLRYAHVGMMNPNVWMYISAHEGLRKHLIGDRTLTSLVELPLSGFKGATVQICAYSFVNAYAPQYRGAYIRLVGLRGGDEEMAAYARQAIADSRCGWLHRASGSDFAKIPGIPIAYWVSPSVIRAFEKHPSLYGSSISDGQNITANNARYVRQFWEVSRARIGVQSGKWVSYAKGGPYRKWAGNLDCVVDWSEPARRAYRSHPSARIIPEYLRFRPGITWSLITSAKQSYRYLPSSATFDKGGSSLFFVKDTDLLMTLGFLNTTLSAHLTALFNPTLNLQVKDVRNLPFEPSQFYSSDATHRVQMLVDAAREDWDSRETSLGFNRHPLMRGKPSRSALADEYLGIREFWQRATLEVLRMEETNNLSFIRAYALEGELESAVPLNEITLTSNPHYRYGSGVLREANWRALCDQFPRICQRLADIATEMAPEMPETERLSLEQRLLDDTMREVISYAVGCMFGRYSLDKPGLILANQSETVADYVRKVSGRAQGRRSVDSDQVEEGITFVPDEDNVIPVLDGDWFADDISERFKAFLRATFGDAHYEENLAFIEAAIGRDIRSYFVREFYDDHVKMYQKRPIYWLFSSPKGSFNALIYMHRYQPDTVSIVLNDYLREFRTKLSAHKAHLEQVSISGAASQRDKTQALKEIDGIDKVLNELRVYEDEVLFPLAMQRVEIDLDDGVLVNYSKFGAALRRVAGLSGKK